MVKIVASPTFKATVDIPSAGGQTVSIEFEFKHKTRTAFLAWAKPDVPQANEDAVLEIASGWTDIEDPFNRDSLTILFENFQAAPTAICEKYAQELLLGRAKN